MKKLLAFITALLVLGTVVFAEVFVKDLGDGNVEVTIFYGNPRATEVWVAGSWTDWAGGAQPMTKVEGGWEYKIVWPMNTEHKYKFLVNDLNGWTRDFKAPAEVDDGFGGFNALIEVAKLVSIEAAKASGDSSALEALLASSGGLKAMTYTRFALMSEFLTREYADLTKKGFELNSVKFLADSNLKLAGNLWDNVPAFIEIKAFSGTKELYGMDPTGEVTTAEDKGTNEFFTGLLFNPFNYLNGGDPKLGHFKVGLQTSYVNLETAYHWAKPSTRSTIIWQTVGELDADKGYLMISNGSAVQSFGDIKLDAAIVPNKTFNAMGIRSWVAATYDETYTFEVQWDSISTADNQNAASEYFDAGYSNVIIGAKALVADLDVRAQVSVPLAIGDLDEGTEGAKVEDALAYQVNVAYSSDMFGVATEYGYFQPNADLIYGKNGGDDALEDNQGQAFAKINPWVAPIDGVKIGVDNKLGSTYEWDTEVSFYLDMKPYVNIDLAKLVGMNMTVDSYAKLAFDLVDGADESFYFNEFGLKFGMTDVSDVIPSFDVSYGLQNAYKTKMLHTIIATAQTKPGVGVQAGLGLRAVDSDASTFVEDANESLAFFLGANYKVASMKNGMFYGAFVYNMDPYDDNKDALKWSDYRPDKGIDEYAGRAMFRLGMIFDF